MIKEYELVVLFHPDLEIDIEKPLEKLRKIIADNKGEITKEDNWGKRKLAYSIRKEDFAVYVYMELKVPAANVKKLQSTLNITSEVLRYLLSLVDPRAAVEAAKKSERESAKEETVKDKESERG